MRFLLQAKFYIERLFSFALQTNQADLDHILIYLISALKKVHPHMADEPLSRPISRWKIQANLNISPKIDLGRRLICDRQVSLNFQAAYVDQIMI